MMYSLLSIFENKSFMIIITLLHTLHDCAVLLRPVINYCGPRMFNLEPVHYFVSILFRSNNFNSIRVK